jgi:23S rRNA (cytidine1920-2'-O)/16S rRNA (cytidine1409-2'-O)-methyltransferase
VTNHKLRLDVALLERGQCASRELARALILAGDVRVDGQVVYRPSVVVTRSSELVVAEPPPYVSRGGFKLAHALDTFGVDVAGAVVVDVGASTGGFTDVLLQRQARRVYAVDVGYGQLAWKIRKDPRVVTMEHTNIRYLVALPEPMDAAVIDVSFISLTLVLPPVLNLLNADGWIIALIKPQFEAGRSLVGKGGVVRDGAIHRDVLHRILTWAETHNLAIGGATASPLLGPAGNREFLALFRQAPTGLSIDDAVLACLGTAEPLSPC